ncbi:hypothetical protein AAGV33_07150 [Flavobacterium sp. FBOR7N2.3]|uniref:Uncharacterized protein n=1 Tax=Flavobacterium magnesitis TaxID=3138077 RepID=A0ABV4TLW6_9FLAO
MNPEQKELAEKVIDFFKKSDKTKIVPGMDLLHLLPDNNSAEKVIYSLEKDFLLLERTSKESFRLTEKGWRFTTFAKLEKESKKLSLFQIMQLSITALSVITAIIFGLLNYFSNLEKADLKEQNFLLKSDIVLYKDSINSYKKQVISKKQ